MIAIQWIAVDALKPNARNARTHSRRQIRQIADSIANFGFLDGTRGLISVGMHVYYTFWKYAKLWELRQLERLGKPVPLPKLDEGEGRWELPWKKDNAS